MSYADLFPPRGEETAEFDLTPVPQADELLPPAPPPRVETAPLQSQIARPVHLDTEYASPAGRARPPEEPAPPDETNTELLQERPRTEDPEVCGDEEFSRRPSEHTETAAESKLGVFNIDVLIRLPSGRRLRTTFVSTDPISRLYDAVEAESSSEPEIRAGYQYWLIQAHPREVYSDKSMTISEAGLQNLTVLNVEMQR